MNPQTQDAQASITQWTQDVNTVNSFLNTVSGIIGDSATLGSAAQTALNSATDEPCQLMTLSSAPDLMDVPAFTCAVQDLMEVFDTHVLMPLTKILVNPSETTTAQAAVDEINFFRCCNVLPDVDVLFVNTIADQVLTGLASSVGREGACTGTQDQCPQKCVLLDGADGQRG
ncbi:hypothetical protein LTR09_004977 [Extremus antarcticus]|uniref:Uncharacterized protein n=1 Tax=Extremus antarcticus TaxID=702011 RepID=A0AAJ0DQA5_9PEZI|nr:hypothetical protein LTR09_004977 [Extremus antarcticus]